MVKKLLIDTENQKFEVNGMDISKAENLIITFSNGEWNYNMCSSSEDNKYKEIETTNSKEKEVSNSDLMDKLLNSPRVESISINIEKVGDVEETHITANLKELKIDDEKAMKEINESIKKLNNLKPRTINIYNSGILPSTGSVIK